MRNAQHREEKQRLLDDIAKQHAEIQRLRSEIRQLKSVIVKVKKAVNS
jgi:hypothetical protein